MRISVISIIFTLSGLTACLQGPGLFKQSNASSDISVDAIDNDGIISGNFSASSGATQTLNAGSSGIKGSSVKFPPGSLSVDADISLEEGASIASSAIASELGVSAGAITAAGPSVVISASKSVNASKPFTLEVPVSGASLYLGDAYERLIIVYKAVDAETGKNYVGIIARSNLTVKGGVISFETKLFGAYQAAYSEEVIKKDVKAKTESQIMTKAAEEKLDPIVWDIGQPSYDADDHDVRIPVAVTGFAKYGRCTMYVHSNKNRSPIYTDSSKDRERLDGLGDVTYDPKEEAEHLAIFRFECTDERGRYAMSDWSSEITVPAKPSSQPTPTPTVSIFNPALDTPEFGTTDLITRISVELNWTVSNASGIVGYMIGYAPGSVADCRSGTTKTVAIDTNVSTQYTMVRNLIPNTLYQFKICAVDSSGKFSVSDDAIIETTINTIPTDVDFTSECNAAALDSTCTVNTSALIADSIIIISGSGDLVVTDGGILGAANSTKSMIIDMGGSVTISGGASIEGNVEIYAQNITVGSGSLLNAAGKGHGGGIGTSNPGSGPAGAYGLGGDGTKGGGTGGAHYGNGGGNGTSAGGTAYVNAGTINPFNQGAGGGNGYDISSYGGAGGGYVFLNAESIIDVTGHVRANGGDGTSSGAKSGGGGAGGTIWINTSQLINSGGGGATLEVKGGLGPSATYQGGGGGGGVIYVNASSCSFTSSGGSMLINGGTGFYDGTTGFLEDGPCQ